MMNLEEVPKEAQLTEDFAKVMSLSNVNDLVKLSENALLIVAIIMYPKFLAGIIKKVKAPSNSTWDKLLENIKLLYKGPTKYYASYDWLCKDKNAACAKNILKKLSSIYDEKAATCFGSENVQNWMRLVANFLLENLKSGELIPAAIRESISSHGNCPFFLDRYSHLNVLDFKDDITTIPTEELNPMIENTLFAPQQQAAPLQAPGEGPPNPLALFFRTLFR